MGSTEEVWRRGAVEIADRVRAREVSCREVVEAHLSRIAAVDGLVHATTVLLEGQGLAAADALDRALARGQRVGPLAGVPMTVKENIDLAGSATTQGAVALAHAIAPVDAPRMARLRAAGAIPIARTNLPDFGLRWHTESSLHGATLNPWDATKTPGGSSGGDAVAVATGMVPLGNGNDFGGSLRFPAQCCGIASLRPSRGRVPYASALSPGEPSMTFQLFAVEGPMARHTRDLRASLAAMSGEDPRDPWTVPAPLVGPPPRRPLGVALTTHPGTGEVAREVAEGVRAAGHALEEAGYRVEEVELPAVDEAAELWLQLVAAEVRTLIEPQIRSLLSESAARALFFSFDGVAPLDLAGYMRALARRNAIARAWAQLAETYPLVLGPVSCLPAFAVGTDLTGPDGAQGVIRSMRLVLTCSLLGLPAAAVPAGMGSSSTPRAVQIIGPMFREDLVLDAAAVIEETLGVLTPVDPRMGPEPAKGAEAS